MKPRRLKRVANYVVLQVQQIDGRIVKQSVPIPRRRAEIPKVREYKEQDPEEKERRSAFGKRFKTAFEISWQEGEQQKQHANYPADRIPLIAPRQFPVVRHAGASANRQTNK